MKSLSIKNNEAVSRSGIPELDYSDFLNYNCALLQENKDRHCVLYYGVPEDSGLRLICCIADDGNASVMVSSSLVNSQAQLDSFTAKNLVFEKFEREIHENYGLGYHDHPWLKPVRYPEAGADKSSDMADYPFFTIEGEELHEVGVGPVHAGIIEPGHFRFMCNGEQILHLEIQLGYQHRGIEELFVEKERLIERTMLAESIAGDSVAGHTSAFAFLMESLAGMKASDEVLFTRTLAQELERIAVHTGDLSAICTDIGYQLGSSVFGRLRTPLINFFQEWCGNRLAKGLIRASYNPFPFTAEHSNRLLNILEAYEPDFLDMAHEISRLPGTLSRFERTGMVSAEQIESIGTVGMAARMHTLVRDIRLSHPYGLYSSLHHIPVIKHHGDVYSRVQIRKEEILQSIGYIKMLLKSLPASDTVHTDHLKLSPSTFALSLVEGWRGEICHAALTDNEGRLSHYKIKDPSFHNWLALALGVRNNEISDFPVSNKSFNLSYCGHDL